MNGSGACRIRLELAGELRGDGRNIALVDAAQRHALMHRLEHDGDATRRERRVDGMSDLRRHGLLRLQAAREDLDDASKLGDSDDLIRRQIGDMGTADKRAPYDARNGS